MCTGVRRCAAAATTGPMSSVSCQSQNATMYMKWWSPSASSADWGWGAGATGEPALLHGLLRCGGCGRLLTTKTEDRGTPRERVVYHCLNRSSAGQCPAPVAIADGRVEPYVEAVMRGQMGDGASRSVQARLSRAEKHARQRGQELAAYRDSPRLLATLGSERFTAGLSVRVEREERSLLELAQARSAVAAVGPGVQELRSGWSRLTLKEKSGCAGGCG